MLKCPFLNSSCLEENCSLWIPKGEVTKKNIPAGDIMAGATVYEHEGCCSFKAIGRNYGR